MIRYYITIAEPGGLYQVHSNADDLPIGEPLEYAAALGAASALSVAEADRAWAAADTYEREKNVRHERDLMAGHATRSEAEYVAAGYERLSLRLRAGYKARLRELSEGEGLSAAELVECMVDRAAADAAKIAP